MGNLIENTSICYGLQPITLQREELVVWISNEDGRLEYVGQVYFAPFGTPASEIEGYNPITILVREIPQRDERLPIVAKKTNMVLDVNNQFAAIFLVLVDNAGIKERKRRNTTVKVTSGGGG